MFSCKNNYDIQQFFKILLEATERKDKKFCLVLVMRADFLDKCSHYVDLAKKIQTDQIIITPMTPEELEEAIVEPTKLVGLQIESKLVSEMLVDVKSLGNLPLLEYTLTELWKECFSYRLLTFSAYVKLGKIAGTLEKAADGIYNKFSQEEKKIAKQIFIELIQLGEGTPDTSRQIFFKDLVDSLPFKSSQVKLVIQQLVAAYLLVIDKSTEQQSAVVNIAHDALAQHWGLLRSWLDKNRNVIKIQRDIEANAKKWEDNNKSKNALLQGLNLNIAKDYMKKHNETVPLSRLAQDFVQHSIKRQRHYRMIMIGAGVGLILISIVFSIYFYQLRIEADEQRKLAEAESERAKKLQIEADEQRKLAEAETKRANKEKEVAEKQAKFALAGKLSTKAFLASELPSLVNGSPDQALLLAIQALNLHNDSNKQGILRYVLQKTNSIIYNKKSILWDIEKNPLFQVYKGHNNAVFGISVDNDSKKAISASIDNTLILLDIETGKAIGKPWNKHNQDVFDVAFSPDGKKVLSASADKTLILWNVETGEPIENPWKGHKNWVWSVDFHPDGKQAISGSKDNTLILWDTQTAKPIGKPWKGHKEDVRSVKFSHDGKMVISGSYDETLILWNAQTGKPIGKPWKGHKHKLINEKATIRSVAFSPDDKWVISASADNTLILWDVKKGKMEGSPWKGHSKVIRSVDFSPDGNRIISGSLDNTLIMWDFLSGKVIGQPWQEEKLTRVSSVVWSPNGKYIISGSEDGTIIFWKADINDWVKIACSKVNRNFTKAEWKQFVGTRDYEKTCPEFPEGK